MVTRQLRRQATISFTEAERAIYIDCEGFQHQSPAVIGILIGDCLEQVVLDPQLEPVARARNHRFTLFASEASRLRNLAIKDGRLIVAYTQHESNLFRRFANIDIGDCYCDAHKLAKRWRNRLHPDIPINNWGLIEFLRVIRFPRGSYLGSKKSTKRIKAVRDMLLSKGSYQLLTPVKKAQWTKLLKHNEIDCRGMRALVIHAALELASA